MFIEIAHAAAEAATHETETGLLGTFGLNWKLFLAQLINFSVIVFVLTKWVYRPLIKTMDARRLKIEEGVKNASLAEQKLGSAKETESKMLREARSQAQEIIYEWLYMLRQKGFKEGVLIFERGSGRGGGKTTSDVFELSVLALRQIAENLEKGIAPKELPLTFYGMSEKNDAVYKRELVAVRDHAWDPLEGVLSVPEEKHSFLSRAAVEKQKAQEWEKRKFR